MPDLVEIGEATDYEDLLDKLVTFAESTTWWTTLQDDSEMTCLQGEGSGAEEIIVAFKKYSDVGTDAFGWYINGFSGYSSGLGFASQPGALQLPSGLSTVGYKAMPLWNDPIPYWFIVSSRRIIVVAKISTTYHSCYAGFFLPYHSPGQYPYPMMIGGSATPISGTANIRFSDTNAQTTGFWTGGGANQGNSVQRAASAYRLPSGTWVTSTNGIQNFVAGNYASSGYYMSGIYPYLCKSLYGPEIANWRETLDGEPVLTPLKIAVGGNGSSTFNGWLGEIDGAYHITGASHSVEDVVSIDGEDYLVVQDVYRTGTDNYCAIHIGATESSSSSSSS